VSGIHPRRSSSGPTLLPADGGRLALAGGDLTSRAEIDAELGRRAALLARAIDAAEPEPLLEIVVFRLGGERYGLETQYIRAVSRVAEMARLPGASTAVYGVTLLRGELLTLVDLRVPLGLSGSALSDLNRILVVGIERAEFGVLADRMDGIASVRSADVSPLTGGAQTHSGLVKGITADAVLILDGAELLRFTFGGNNALDH